MKYAMLPNVHLICKKELLWPVEGDGLFSTICLFGQKAPSLSSTGLQNTQRDCLGIFTIGTLFL